MRRVRLLSTLALLFLLPATAALAQTGKISGVVRDAGGTTMPGVNVVIDGTTQGSVTDADGFYFINNVRPGTYTLRASFVGFVSEVVKRVRVSTGLTTNVDFTLREEAVGLDEVTVTAERPVVQLDVSANVANLNPAEFEDLPLSGVSEVLDLQAGIEPGLRVRGGGLNEIAFVVDGLNLRTGRGNEPFTAISYTALEEVQVQTGGFNAEYGNVRSGIVNVATKEPSRNRYTFDGIFRFAPPQDKSLGGLPEDFDSFYIRPALDPEVRDNYPGNWSIYQQRQYTTLFEGWDRVVERLQGEGFDVTNEDMIEYFKYTHRKSNKIDVPDYEADFTFGGPLIPGVSEKLGDLRFLFSYRGQQTAYLYPQTRNAFDQNTFQLKVISNIRRGMRLTLHGMRATERGVTNNRNNPQVDPWRGNLPRYPWQGSAEGGDIGLSFAQPFEDISRRGVVIFSDGGFTRANIDHNLLGLTFTHTLNQSTFYEVTLQNLSSKYRSHFPNLRDGSFVDDKGVFHPVLWTDNFGTPTPEGQGKVTCFGGTSDLNGDGIVQGYCAGTEPFGYAGTGGNLITGETTGGHWSKTRDTSDVSVFTGRFDLTSQVNRFLQIKTGAELIVSDFQMHFARVNLALIGPEPEQDYSWQRSPIQGAAYVQGKLEFEGMIANLGLRLDYFDANEPWWVFGPYDQALRGRVDVLDANLAKQNPDAQTFLSPRLGISFPITSNSKLYFNYGHFRQMLNPSDVFGVRQSKDGGIDVIGNPNHPMPLTVAYELGFDQNLFDQFLLRVSGFYRDIRDQPRAVTFESLGGVVNYQTDQPWNYADVRGAEFTLTKNRGNWIRGFINYTFLQTKSGNFGFANFFENSFDQRNYLLTSTDYRLNSPIAEPFARANFLFLTPGNFGPQVLGGHPLADLRMSVLTEWRSGQKWTWHGGGGTFPELRENVAWRDFWNFDLRFTKHVDTPFGDAQLFLDIDNIFNQKYIYRTAAFHPDNQDFERYMWSLHLPGNIYDDLNLVDPDADFKDKEGLPYLWVPGNDKPGDYRGLDVPFQPIEAVSSLDAADPNPDAWFWAKDTGTYNRWNGSSWEPVPDGEVKKVLDSKAYIDMPNLRFNTFLNPRRYTIGLRYTF